MKKFILGLFLTVGVSGITLANNATPNVSENKAEILTVKNKLGNVEKKQIITYNYVNGSLFSCTIATHTYEYNTCGQVTRVWKESYEATGSECAGIEGGIKIRQVRFMSGFGDCPASW